MKGLLFVTCIASWLLLPSPSRAQLSPGPLSDAHHSLEGGNNCFKCHAQGSGVVDSRCISCHTEIAWGRTRNRGLHSKVQGTPCAKCHPDHAGQDFQMVRWDEGAPEKFDHKRAGFPLEQKHATLACRECHKPAFQKSGAAALIRQHDRSRSWLGLETACAACHADPHKGELGADCQRCHGQSSWKPASGFDHAKTSYPLTGKHATVECAACHAQPKAAAVAGHRTATVSPTATSKLFKGVPHADCTPCHRDPHAGRFPGACAKCHSTEGFHQVDKRAFDHDRTRFALKGKHGDVACAKCHDPKTAGGARPPFAHCASCHRDSHRGQATLAGKPADCAACHNERGWAPSTFTLASHQFSRYPLEGQHTRAVCALCHSRSAEPGATAKLGSSRVVFRPATSQCTDCHVDAHKGRFQSGGARPQKGGCRTCHSMEAFSPAALGLADHTQARYGFMLEGAHRAIPCVACHTELKGAKAASTLRGATVRVSFTAEAPQACAGCHKDPHGGQFADRKATRAGAPGNACEACHGLDSFEPASHFDHERDATFRLGGAHARVPCASCHRPVRVGTGPARVLYRPTPARCEDCHVVKRDSQGKPVVSPESRGKS